MRIITGEHRGRTIESPPGEGTRPTTDRVRESIMSSVYSMTGGFEGLRVLDAFAGSGAMGLEAMSRGASFALLNDRSRDSLEAIRRNVDKLGYSPSEIAVCSTDAESCGLPGRGAPFSLVFLDPPYRMDQGKVVDSIVDAIDKGLLSQDCIIVYEHDEPLDESRLEGLPLTLRQEKKIGKTFVSYMNTM